MTQSKNSNYKDMPIRLVCNKKIGKVTSALLVIHAVIVKKYLTWKQCPTIFRNVRVLTPTEIRGTTIEKKVVRANFEKKNGKKSDQRVSQKLKA